LRKYYKMGPILKYARRQVARIADFKPLAGFTVHCVRVIGDVADTRMISVPTWHEVGSIVSR